MSARDTPAANDAPASASGPGYEAYAQLVKMLLPSSGCLAVYGPDGDLVWCADGYEHPDLREIVDKFRGRAAQVPSNRGHVCQTAAGARALVARLDGGPGQTFGFIVIELGASQGSMAASMMRPLFQCLGRQLGLERRADGKTQPPADARLDFLVGVGNIDFSRRDAIDLLLRRGLEYLDCVSAVLCVPDYDLTIVASRDVDIGEERRNMLERTRKHLLAWVQLNNRPMVVNRVETGSNPAPYKLLSCPARSDDGQASGVLALFRDADAENFELNDVRLIEFMTRHAMSVLRERIDGLSGLASRAELERRIGEALGHSQGRPAKAGGAVVYVDIKGLRSINEAFGFVVGDEAIKRVAVLIRRMLGSGDVACRLAGDRYVVYLPGADAAEARSLAESLEAGAAKLGYSADGRTVPIALRIGIAAADDRMTTANHWVAAAESACRAYNEDPDEG